MSKSAVRIEIVKAANENPLSVLKRFTKKVSGAGILRRVRSLRYKERVQSELKRKQQALKRMTRRAERERLFRLGKLEHVANTRNRR